MCLTPHPEGPRKGGKCPALKHCIFCRDKILVSHNIFILLDGRVTGAIYFNPELRPYLRLIWFSGKLADGRLMHTKKGTGFSRF